MGAVKQAFVVDQPFYCRRCKEMLADGQAVCPFCDSDATPFEDEMCSHCGDPATAAEGAFCDVCWDEMNGQFGVGA
jgi:predicted amidophosphoribosyltransferase